MGFKKAGRGDASTEGSANYFKLRDWVGEVLAFEVLHYDPDYKNNFDEHRPAVQANVTVASGPSAGTTWERVWVEAEYVVNKLKGEVGDTIVGEIVKKKAFFLNEPTDEQYDAAVAVLTGGGSQPDDAPPF